jgi:RNA polymerase sigma-70 factor (ECF subfamily)
MLRDTTFNALTRTDAAEDAATEFVMDEETFRGFYERTARGVWAYLARITGDRQLADDLAQEAYYRFLRAGAAHESEAHRRNSLYRIATNLARDARRRQVVRSIVSSEVEHVADADQTGTPEAMADFRRAMSHLKPNERAMLWLAYAEGASHAEIAEVLGLSPGSLKPLLFRARRKLAVLLGRRPGGER